MKIAKIAELRDGLSRFLDHVKAGGKVLILDRNRPVAEIVPVGTSGFPRTGPHQSLLVSLERKGIVQNSRSKVSPDLLSGPLPGAGARVLDALLDERRTGR